MIVMIVMAAAHHSPAKHSPAKQSRAGYAKLLKTKLSDSKQSNWVTVEMIVAHFLTKKGAANMSQNDDDMIYDEDLLIEAALTFAKKTWDQAAIEAGIKQERKQAWAALEIRKNIGVLDAKSTDVCWNLLRRPLGWRLLRRLKASSQARPVGLQQKDRDRRISFRRKAMGMVQWQMSRENRGPGAAALRELQERLQHKWLQDDIIVTVLTWRSQRECEAIEGGE
jgi:hypothetical protein